MNKYLAVVLHKTVPGPFQSNILFILLEENCGFKDTVAIISGQYRGHFGYLIHDGDSNYHLPSNNFVSGNTLMYQVGENICILQIRKLKLKKCK